VRLFLPPLGLDSGEEFAGIQLRLEFVEDLRGDASWRTLPGTGFLTREQGFETSFPHCRQPAEKVTSGNAAKISDLSGSMLSAGS
jgi:hypothetical protein